MFVLAHASLPLNNGAIEEDSGFITRLFASSVPIKQVLKCTKDLLEAGPDFFLLNAAISAYIYPLDNNCYSDTGTCTIPFSR